MRTTLNIDDEVLDFAQNLATVQRISLGDAVSRLAKCGMRAPNEEMERDPVSGFWTFMGFDVSGSDVSGSEDAPPITSKDVRKALDREAIDEYEKCFPKS